MGSLILPDSGTVYVDSQVLIYSVEKIPQYAALLTPFWDATRGKRIRVVTSEIAIVEVLTGPMKHGNKGLTEAYDKLLGGSQIDLLPIGVTVLREAARLRSVTSLRTPDAIHAATAFSAKCAAFITNDMAFRNVVDLPVQLLRDCLNA